MRGGRWFQAGAQPLQIVTRPPTVVVLLTHCGQLIRRKVSKFDAIRSQILRLEYIKFDLRWGPSPRPTGCFKGPISKGRKGKMWRRIGMGRREGEVK